MPEPANTIAQGWVYLIVNDLVPNRVKIGFTARDPIDRANELISTGTTGTFVVIYQALVHKPYRVEQAVHRRLKHLNRGLEWFEVCPNRAKNEILAVAGIVLYENTSPRWHPSQPSPKDSTKELLEEARRAAEEARLAEATAKKRQAEEEEAARRAAEAERIRLEREVEQRRRQAELQEARRRAEEQAMRTAEAERQRRAAEEKKAQARARNALIGKIILAAACLLTVMCVLGAMSYVTISQVSAAHSRRVAATKMEVDRLTTLLQSTRSSLARHRDAIDRLARELYSAKQSQQGLPHAIAECKKRLRDATSSRVRHSRALADKVESLRGLPNAEFDVASKKLVAETERYRALTDNAEQELNEKRRAYSQALERVEAIPEEISDSQKQIALLEKEEATIEQELAQAKQSARNVFAKPTPAMPSR